MEELARDIGGNVKRNVRFWEPAFERIRALRGQKVSRTPYLRGFVGLLACCANNIVCFHRSARSNVGSFWKIYNIWWIPLITWKLDLSTLADSQSCKNVQTVQTSRCYFFWLVLIFGKAREKQAKHAKTGENRRKTGAFLVLMFLGEKLVGANFYAFCNYAPHSSFQILIFWKMLEKLWFKYIWGIGTRVKLPKVKVHESESLGSQN